MVDYDDAARDFRSRREASSSLTAHAKGFYQTVLSSLSEEVTAANESLMEENLPQITFVQTPEAQLTLAETKCNLHVNQDPNLILAIYSGPSWEETFRFTVNDKLAVAHNATKPWSPDAELGPADLASEIVNRLIASAE